MIRDGIVHYDLNYIKELVPHYINAFDIAMSQYRTGDYSRDMNYKNFDYLDEDFVMHIDLDKMYYKLNKIYNKLDGNLK